MYNSHHRRMVIKPKPRKSKNSSTRLSITESGKSISSLSVRTTVLSAWRAKLSLCQTSIWRFSGASWTTCDGKKIPTRAFSNTSRSSSLKTFKNYWLGKTRWACWVNSQTRAPWKWSIWKTCQSSSNWNQRSILVSKRKRHSLPKLRVIFSLSALGSRKLAVEI